jgi:hypothetical protein
MDFERALGESVKRDGIVAVQQEMIVQVGPIEYFIAIFGVSRSPFIFSLHLLGASVCLSNPPLQSLRSRASELKQERVP